MRNPEYYVLWYRFRSNCGRPDCGMKACSLLPLSSQIKYLRSTQKELMEKPLDRFERWFLLRPEEFGDLPIDVKVKCQTKDCQEVKIVKARWTGHVPPRFVMAVHKCQKSGRRSNWKPNYPSISGANLSRLWKSFCVVPGFDITCCPRRPDIYFDDSLTIDGRVAALIEAQRLMQDEQVGELTN